MRRKTLLWLVAFAMVFAGCQPKNGPENKKGLTLSSNSELIIVGEFVLLEAETSATVTWTSSNPEVASVNGGLVEGKSIGHAVITAKTEDNQQATCEVGVLGKDARAINLSPRYVQLKKGETFQYTYGSAYGTPLTWRSSNPEIATVDDKGQVTALKPGHTTISICDGLDSLISILAVEHTWGEYKLVWSDEFEGSELNKDNWNIEVNGSGGGNREEQYYTDRSKNIRVEDGMLIIEAHKESYSDPGGTNKKEYTSGRINSRDKKFFTYGKIESRISFPKGGGTWPAFWMMGNDYSKVGWPKCGEIDIIEHIGNNPRMCSFAVHTPAKNTDKNWSARAYFDNVEENFHVYGIEWIQEETNGADAILFTYDGQVCAKILEDVDNLDINHYWPFNKDHFIILNLAIGGKMGGNVDVNIFENPVLMKVDWVRVYQHEEIE